MTSPPGRPRRASCIVRAQARPGAPAGPPPPRLGARAPPAAAAASWRAAGAPARRRAVAGMPARRRAGQTTPNRHHYRYLRISASLREPFVLIGIISISISGTHEVHHGTLLWKGAGPAPPPAPPASAAPERGLPRAARAPARTRRRRPAAPRNAFFSGQVRLAPPGHPISASAAPPPVVSSKPRRPPAEGASSGAPRPRAGASPLSLWALCVKPPSALLEPTSLSA